MLEFSRFFEFLSQFKTISNFQLTTLPPKAVSEHLKQLLCKSPKMFEIYSNIFLTHLRGRTRK